MRKTPWIILNLLFVSRALLVAQLPPVVSVTITAPASGATVGGAIDVTAETSGPGASAVAGVQFKLDGVNLGAEDTASPYSVSWNTTTAVNGSHTLTAVARDTTGNTTISAGVTVTVSNSGVVTVTRAGRSFG